VTTYYKASDIISILDASLLLFGKNPNQRPSYPGDGGWIVVLTRDREVYDLAHMLLEEVEKGLIKAKRSWLRDIPPSWKHKLGSLPGELDPRYTEVGISELVKFAIRHNLKPDFLAHLMTAPTALEGTVPNKQVRRPRRERVEQAIKDPYPNGVPDQASESNKILLKKVDDWLEANKLPGVGDDTILRAAGRRQK
jgi:hypothetical protein